MVDMTVGDRLRQLREDQGLTLEEAGRIAGTTKQSASQIEKGVTKAPGGIFLYRWSRHYGVDLEWLITGKGEKRPASQSARLVPDKVREAHESIRAVYAHLGKTYSIEAEPDLFVTVYEETVKLGHQPNIVEMARISRVIENRQQGATDEGEKRPERIGGAHSGKGKERAAG